MRLLPVLLLFNACVQIQADNSNIAQDSSTRPVRVPRRSYDYRLEATTQLVGFDLVVNGFEVLLVNNGANHTTQVLINDWMISGSNDISVTVLWPEGIEFNPGQGSATFRLFSNTTLVREFRWPASGIPNIMTSYPHEFSDTFRSSGFPTVMLERAERVISSAGRLPADDQAEIVAIAAQLRRAFVERDMESINYLLRAKYEDLATARFTTAAEIRAEENTKFQELMGKEAYTVAFSGRNSFNSVANDRVVRLGQGRIGFPEPALIISYRENRRTERWNMELYFAKIDGNWVIIR